MTPAGLAQLKSDEGFRPHAYPDPLTGGAPWTVGFGATGPGIGPNTIWTEPQANAALMAALAHNETAMSVQIPWWADLIDTPRGDVLEGMCYNLGFNGLMGFAHMLASVKSGAYGQAAIELLDSTAARELPQRYGRYAAIMRDGAYPETAE